MTNITIIPYVIDDDIEKFISNTIKRQIGKISYYSNVTNDQCKKITQDIIKNFNVTMSYPCEIINSIKSCNVRETIINNNYKIDKHKNDIFNIYIKNEKLFDNNTDYSNPILIVSEKYNLSPLNIMRFIIKKKYSQKLTSIDKKILSTFDDLMITYAIAHDEYALIDGKKILNDSLQFEKDVEQILIKKNIKYKTQDQLVKEQIKSHGKPFNTPDFLILSNFYVNDVKINWIDAKRFYGSRCKFVARKIDSQTKKYISSYGSGLIVFKYGFNSKLSFNNITLIDYDTLNDNIYT